MTVLTSSLSCAGTFLYSIVPRHIVLLYEVYQRVHNESSSPFVKSHFLSVYYLTYFLIQPTTTVVFS